MSAAQVPGASPALSADGDAIESFSLLLVADMRSPHSINWACGLLALNIQPIIVSSRRLNSDQRAALPDAIANSIINEPRDPVSRTRIWLTRTPALLRTARKFSRGSATDRKGRPQRRRPARPEGVGRLELPLELLIAAFLRRTIRRAVRQHRPHLVHALRVPFEGIATSGATLGATFAISIWGSDLVRQAPSSPRLAKATRRALGSVSAVHADCRRDVMLAHEWGVPDDAHSIIAPGNMGYDTKIFNASGLGQAPRDCIIFPRGPATAINYIGFMHAASQIVSAHSDIKFVGVRLRGDPECEAIRRACIDPDRIILTGLLSQAELAGFYRRAIAVVSPSASDGTPNSVLEAMACGAIPVVGDIPPLRELLMPAFADNLIHPYDTPMMHASIERILTFNPRRREWNSEQARHTAAGWSREATLNTVRGWYQTVFRDERTSGVNGHAL